MRTDFTISITCIMLAAGAASAQLSSGGFDVDALGAANVVQGATVDAFHVDNLGSSGQDGVKIRRIAIGEAGVKEHISGLKVGWPDPFGLETNPGAAIATSLVADPTADGNPDQIRLSTVTWQNLGVSGGLTRYALSVDFALLGASTATLRVKSGDSVVTEIVGFDSGSTITLDGLPPGEPVVREVLPGPGIVSNWSDPDDDGDGFFDVGLIEVAGLPDIFSGFTLADGTSFDLAATSIEIDLGGAGTALDGVFGLDITGSGLGGFSVSGVPAPGTAALLLAAGAIATRRRREHDRDPN